MKTKIITLLVLFTVAIGAASAQAAPKILTLSNFGRQNELARFSVQGEPQSDLALNASPGGGALLTLEKVQPDVTGFPSLVLTVDKGLTADWSGYDILAVDVRNNSLFKVDFGLTVMDSKKTSAVLHFTLDAGKSETAQFPFGQMGKVDLAQVKEIHIFAVRPAQDGSLSLSNLRLMEDLPGRLAVICKNLEAQDKGAKEYGLGDELKRASVSADALQTSLNQAANSDARDALRPQFTTVEGDVRQLATDISAKAAARVIADRDAARAKSEAKMRDAFRKIDPKSPYACGFATSMTKVFPQDIPFDANVARYGSVELAGNEVESLQLLVLAGKDALNSVTVSVGDLTSADGKATLSASDIQVSPVGFVKTKMPTDYHATYAGWYPDPILDFLKSFDVKAGEMQPVWIRITTPPGAAAGEYRGEITVRPANAPAVKLGLHVKVWDFDVPAETHLRAAVSFREPMIAQVYGTETDAMRNKYYDFLLKYRINPDNIYRYDAPSIDDLIKWNKMGMNAFNITYVVKPADLKPNAPYPADLKAKIMAQLADIVPKLKANGLYDKAYVYGFDEINRDSYNAMRDIFGAIKAKYPDLLLMTTGRDASYGTKTGLSMVDAWVPLTPVYNQQRADEVRAAGKQVWWYTCIVPQAPYANWFIEYDAIDARILMGMQTAKYKPDGYLYYAMDRWPLSKAPITGGPYTDWNPESIRGANGDGSVMCAGPDGPLATIRLENIRDGIEDDQYFWLLSEDIAKLKASNSPDAPAALKQAMQAEEIGPKVVQDMTHFTKSPDVLLAKRRQVAEAILAAEKVVGR